MTREEILNMPAGRELDALIAEKWMNWKDIHKANSYTTPSQRVSMGGDGFIIGTRDDLKWYCEIPNFSSSTFLALQVFEEMKGYAIFNFGVGWRCEYEAGKGANGLDAPLAICRAALLKERAS